MVLEEGDIVMCTVDRIVGTVVFVKIDGDGEGSIIMSEIAPGRIRNLRDYVFPKKRIVCKVLRISGDRIDLSLRRVTPKEQKEIIEKGKQEKSYMGIIKSVSKEKAEEVIKEITKIGSVYDFLNESKENSAKLEKIAGKEDCKKILEILNSQKQKKVIVKKEISLSTTKPNGIEIIKKILGKFKDIEIIYISAGKYFLRTESNDPKIANSKIKDAIIEIEKDAKQERVEFSVK